MHCRFPALMFGVAMKQVAIAAWPKAPIFCWACPVLINSSLTIGSYCLGGLRFALS